MKRVDLSELGGAELADTIPGAKKREPRSKVEVYVVELNLSDGTGWTSVHRTYEGARARLEQKAAEWGVIEDLLAAEAGEVKGAACTASGFEGDPLTYGISRLPVED